MLFLFFLFRMTPRRLRTAASFSAPDPWHGGQLTAFTVESYAMMPRSASKFAATRQLSEPHPALRYGIKSEMDGEERMLPEFLSALWRAGKAPAESLPQMLYDVSPRLKKTDFNRYRAKAVAILTSLYLLVGVVLLGLALYLWPNASQKALLQPAKVVEPPDESSWDKLPPDAKSVRFHRSAPLDGWADSSVAVSVPPSITAPLAKSGEFLAWKKSAAGTRLLLVPEPFRVGAKYGVDMDGIFMAPNEIGIPDSVLQQLKERVPDLNTQQILCLEWFSNAPDPKFRERMHIQQDQVFGWACLILGSFILALGALLFLIFYPKWHRHRVNTAWALARLSESHA